MMLATTLVPTFIHITSGLAGIFAVGSGANARAAERIAKEKNWDAFAIIKIRDQILRARLWLIPSTICAGALVCGLAYPFFYFVNEIGILLVNIAYCTTSWH